MVATVLVFSTFFLFSLWMAGGSARITEVGLHNHPFIYLFIYFIVVKFTYHFNHTAVTIQWLVVHSRCGATISIV